MTAAARTPALRTVSERAMDWLSRDQAHGRLPADASADLSDPDTTYKPLGESAMAASLVLREEVAAPATRRQARDLLAFAWEELSGGDLLYQRQLRHLLMTDPLEVYTHFARAGYRHAPLERLLARLGHLASYRGVEQLPNRRLAVANAARVAGLAWDTDWPALAAATWLGQTPEPWAVDWMTAYCMTHTVFHLTDWSARPGGLPARLAGYLERWLPVWADVWAEIEEWDLLAELAVVDACLPGRSRIPESWDLLVALQHPDGLVPVNGRPVTDDPRQAFRDHRHTTVVTAVAATLALSRGAATAAAP